MASNIYAIPSPTQDSGSNSPISPYGENSNFNIDKDNMQNDEEQEIINTKNSFKSSIAHIMDEFPDVNSNNDPNIPTTGTENNHEIDINELSRENAILCKKKMTNF